LNQFKALVSIRGIINRLPLGKELLVNPQNQRTFKNPFNGQIFKLQQGFHKTFLGGGLGPKGFKGQGKVPKFGPRIIERVLI